MRLRVVDRFRVLCGREAFTLAQRALAMAARRARAAGDILRFLAFGAWPEALAARCAAQRAFCAARIRLIAAALSFLLLATGWAAVPDAELPRTGCKLVLQGLDFVFDLGRAPKLRGG